MENLLDRIHRMIIFKTGEQEDRRNVFLFSFSCYSCLPV